MKVIRKQTHKSGFALVLIISILFFLFVFGLWISSLAFLDLQSVKKDKFNTGAQYAAESGVHRGLVKLRSNPTWDGTTDGSGQESKLEFKEIFMPGGVMKYTVRVYNNFSGSAMMNGPMGMNIPAGSCLIMGEGSSGMNSAKKVSVMVGGSGSPFDNGIFAEQDIAINGNVTIDAYDSTTGLKVPGEADVTTNSSGSGSISVKGSAVSIDGTLVAGHGANVDDAITTNGHPSITGDPQKDSLDSVENMASVAVPEGLPELSLTGNFLTPGDYRNAGVLNIRTQDYTLRGAPGGAVYIFSGITGASGGQLKIDNSTGPVKIYLTGDLNFSGQSGISIIGADQDPGDVLIYMTEGANVDLSGQASVAAAIYAPDSNFDMSGVSVFYGGVVVDTLNMVRGNTTFHYDVNLKNLDITPNSVVVKSWQYF